MRLLESCVLAISFAFYYPFEICSAPVILFFIVLQAAELCLLLQLQLKLTVAQDCGTAFNFMQFHQQTVLSLYSTQAYARPHCWNICTS
ncbi:UNVERIFIED_CONTAM: hypothetical protein FKN15_015109 [Acipenser sinensis]